MVLIILFILSFAISVCITKIGDFAFSAFFLFATLSFIFLVMIYAIMYAYSHTRIETYNDLSKVDTQPLDFYKMFKINIKSKKLKEKITSAGQYTSGLFILIFGPVALLVCYYGITLGSTPILHIHCDKAHHRCTVTSNFISKKHINISGKPSVSVSRDEHTNFHPRSPRYDYTLEINGTSVAHNIDPKDLQVLADNLQKFLTDESQTQFTYRYIPKKALIYSIMSIF